MKLALVNIILCFSVLTTKAEPILQAMTLDLTSNDYKKLGSAVSTSGDIAVIGAPGLSSDNGQACLYQYSAEKWSLLSCLSPSSENSATIQQFGRAVAISGDLVVIGAEKQSQGKKGVAYIYQRQGDSWSLQAELNSPETNKNDNFASTLSVTGNYIAIGSQGIAASHIGQVHLFKNTDLGWIEDTVITPNSTFKSARFGSSVMLADDYLIIGDDDHGRAHEGSAYIYHQQEGIWNLQASLKGGDITKGAKFASSVAISKHYAVVGARLENNPSIKKHKKSGAAYVYKRTGKLWTNQAKLLASDAAQGDSFGASVAIFDDHLVIGATSSNSGKGASYLFKNTNEVWSEVFKFSAADAKQQDNYGNTVSIVEDTIIIAANNKTHTNNKQGVAYFYSLNRNTSPSDRERELLSTQIEVAYNANELDTDSDGLNDQDEINILGTDPKLSDSDNDGLTDKEEVMLYQSNPLIADTDKDGLTDLDEVVIYNSDPTLIDSDLDGASDYEEVTVTKTEPSLVDSDLDGLTDQQELLETGTDPTLADSDGDGLTDNEELYLFNTDPHDADSDNDGFSDGNELNFYETLH